MQKILILNVWQGSEYVSAICATIIVEHLSVRTVGYLFTKFHRISSNIVHSQITWPYVQHVCWITKIITRVFEPYVSIDYDIANQYNQ